MDNFLSKNIKYLREKQDLNQDDLANMLNLKSYSTVGKWENGKNSPSLEIVKKLAIIFNVDFRDLVDEDLTTFKRIKITPTNSLTKTPIVILGTASCGKGFDNEQNVQEYIELPSEWVKNDIYGAYASGDSMIGVGIADKSLLLLRPQETLENNQIGAFHLNGEEYIKKYKEIGNVILLQSANASYEDIEVTEKDNFRIIAKVTKIITNLDKEQIKWKLAWENQTLRKE